MLRYQIFNEKAPRASLSHLQLIAEVHEIDHALVVLQEWGDLLWDTYEQEWIGPDRAQHEPASPAEHPLNRGIYVAGTELHEQMPAAVDKVVEIRKLLHAKMPCSEDADCLHCELVRLTI